MNHYLATYIDLIQSFGFVFIVGFIIALLGKLFLDHSKDNFIDSVKVRVDE